MMEKFKTHYESAPDAPNTKLLQSVFKQSKKPFVASSPLLQNHYPCPSHHGNRKTSGRAHQRRALNPEGDQLLFTAMGPCPPLHLPCISLLIATYSLCNQEANAALTQHPTCIWFHFPPLVPPFHTLPPTLSSFCRSCIAPTKLDSAPLLATLCTWWWDRLGEGG